MKEHYLSINTLDYYSVIYYPISRLKLKLAYKYLIKYHIPFRVVGNKTNIFGSFNFVLIDLSLLKRKLKYKGDKIIVSSNVGLHYLSYSLSKLSIITFSYYPFLPGSIGGAIYQNAGIKNHSISDDLISIKILNEKGKIEKIKKENLKFYYRCSSLNFRSIIILEACFKKIINKDALKIRKQIIEIRNKQPKGYSMGSIFKNLGNQYAGRIVENLGYKGKIIDGLLISNKHANFILNINQLNSSYLRKLISQIKLDALLKLDVRLETEVIEFI